MWERGWSFIKMAGTIILLSTIIVWFATFFGFVDGAFTMLEEEQIDHSILAMLGKALAWIFLPLGFGDWEATVASITGLVAKENIVGTMGVLYGAEGSAWAALADAFTSASGLSFLLFNLLCAPCFAAMGAIKREMNNGKWTAFAIGYECFFAYIVSFTVYQIGNAFAGNVSILGLIFAIAIIVCFIWLLFRPYKEATKLEKEVRV
jgi:ferrous iron transport protein B